MRLKSCDDLKVTRPSRSMIATRCCILMSGIARWFTTSASLSPTLILNRSTSCAREFMILPQRFDSVECCEYGARRPAIS